MKTTLERLQTYEAYIPMDLLSFQGFFLANFVLFMIVLIRYGLMVSPFYVFFWKLVVRKPIFKRLHDQQVPKGQIKFELKWSIVSSLIFSFAGYCIGVFWQVGWSQIYLDLSTFGYWYLPLSVLILSLIHEVYFYFTHVWMHRPGIYQKVHAVHHKSIKTSPFASFSFHPYEAVVHAAFLPMMVCIVPLHPLVILIYLTIMTITAISNHLGVELIPSKLVKKYFISGTHHSIHHQKFRVNYGLYFRFVDQLMKTEHMESES